MPESPNYSSRPFKNCHQATPEMHLGAFFFFFFNSRCYLFIYLHFIVPCFFSLQVLMSVVLHYAVPPGFNLASGKVGLTPRLWSPSAYYSLSLVGGPSGCRLGGCWMGVAVLRE